MHITDAKELLDALVAKYDTTTTGSKLYTMESFHGEQPFYGRADS
jgi:hypothetical protein